MSRLRRGRLPTRAKPESSMSGREWTIRPLLPDRESEIAHVAQRMRLTLIEVLGEQAGRGRYSDAWLVDRVRAHLDPTRLNGAGFLAELPNVGIVGHLLARPEQDGTRTIGLIATVYVEPAERGRGIASRLFDAGEAWLRARSLDEIAYDTGEQHRNMIGLLTARAYSITHRAQEQQMVRLTRRWTTTHSPD